MGLFKSLEIFSGHQALYQSSSDTVAGFYFAFTIFHPRQCYQVLDEIKLLETAENYQEYVFLIDRRGVKTMVPIMYRNLG